MFVYLFVCQFKSALKKILLRASIVGSRHANCMTFEVDESPFIFSLKWTKNRASMTEKNVDDEIPDVMIEMSANAEKSSEHSLFKRMMLAYMGGYICRKLQENLP